ncbi:MAG: hypothetical protein OEW17_03760 [Gemmatimonadota bacterium]|nr:hypothetical protein [Gemmatimonadota bacterium]MDH4347898.1 hypothetical protein [Gemmatimonadota bacterium]
MRILAQPRDLAELTEIDPAVPGGEGDRFSGYGVMGLPFSSGHVLALRRFPASSLGYGYSSVWHCDPEGRWTFWSDNSPDASCARYFGREVDRAMVAPIRITWAGPRRFRVVVGDGAIDWSVDLVATPATLLMNAVGACLPAGAWQRPAVPRVMSLIAGPLLGVGAVRLSGCCPNGQRFTASPRQAWMVGRSKATVDGVSIGVPGPLKAQAFLADFAIPQRGIFVIGRSRLESFDPGRHSRVLARGETALPAGRGPAF